MTEVEVIPERERVAACGCGCHKGDGREPALCRCQSKGREAGVPATGAASVEPAERDSPTPGSTPLGPTLDAAWAECEAALPEGWQFVELKLYSETEAPRAFARARLTNDIEVGHEAHGMGETPTAALQALTTLLRDRTP